MWKRKYLSYLLSLSLAVVVALVLSEVILHLVGFSYHFIPERVEFGWPDPEVMETEFQSDKDLFWTTPKLPKILAIAEQTDSAFKPSLIFMGCSCTHYGSYPSRLRDKIQDDFEDSEIQILNAGVGGWSTYQGLVQLKRDILPLKPDVVTIYYGWNDHWLGFGVEDKEIALLNSKYYRLLNSTKLFQLYAKSYVNLKYRSDQRIIKTRVTPEDFRKNLTEMVVDSKKHGVVPLLLTAPTSFTPGEAPQSLKTRWFHDLDELVPTHNLYAEIVREVAAAEDALLVDLHKLFNGFAVDTRKTLIPDGIHASEEGDQIIAEELYVVLEKAGILEKLIK